MNSGKPLQTHKMGQYLLYTGVSAFLPERIEEHREKINPKNFTSKYNIYKLIYFENFHSIEEAIGREKQVKKYSRKKKVVLINNMNPDWIDLYDTLE